MFLSHKKAQEFCSSGPNFFLIALGRYTRLAIKSTKKLFAAWPFLMRGPNMCSKDYQALHYILLPRCN